MMATATDWVSMSALTLIAAAVGINTSRGTLPQWLRSKFLLSQPEPSVTVIGTDLGAGLTAVTPVPPVNPNPGSGVRYADPLPSGSLISGWGACRTGITCSTPCCRRHKGVDLAAPTGTPVLSVAPGRVTAAGIGGGGCGLRVWVKHSDGSSALYCHLSSLSVSAGAAIDRAGIPLGGVGTSGNATGTSPHVHFELHFNGSAVDPTRLIGR